MDKILLKVQGNAGDIATAGVAVAVAVDLAEQLFPSIPLQQLRCHVNNTLSPSHPELFQLKTVVAQATIPPPPPTRTTTTTTKLYETLTSLSKTLPGTEGLKKRKAGLNRLNRRHASP